MTICFDTSTAPLRRPSWGRVQGGRKGEVFLAAGVFFDISQMGGTYFTIAVLAPMQRDDHQGCWHPPPLAQAPKGMFAQQAPKQALTVKKGARAEFTFLG